MERSGVAFTAVKENANVAMHAAISTKNAPVWIGTTIKTGLKRMAIAANAAAHPYFFLWRP